MNFCESCNIARIGERCPKCGKKNLRAVNDEDFCLAGEVDRLSGDDLKSHLENEKIDCVLVPFGTGVRSKFALPLESYLLYVRYENLGHVRQILKK